jgi:ABC-type phosphate transport system permease subunit
MKEETFNNIFCAFIIWILIIPSCLWNGFVLSKLWLWIAVPIFGVRPLGIAQAIAVSVLVAFFLSRPNRTKDTRGVFERTAESACYMILSPLISLGIGFIVSRFL